MIPLLARFTLFLWARYGPNRNVLTISYLMGGRAVRMVEKHRLGGSRPVRSPWWQNVPNHTSPDLELGITESWHFQTADRRRCRRCRAAENGSDASPPQSRSRRSAQFGRPCAVPQTVRPAIRPASESRAPPRDPPSAYPLLETDPRRY